MFDEVSIWDKSIDVGYSIAMLPEGSTACGEPLQPRKGDPCFGAKAPRGSASQHSSQRGPWVTRLGIVAMCASWAGSTILMPYLCDLMISYVHKHLSKLMYIFLSILRGLNQRNIYPFSLIFHDFSLHGGSTIVDRLQRNTGKRCWAPPRKCLWCAPAVQYLRLVPWQEGCCVYGSWRKMCTSKIQPNNI